MKEPLTFFTARIEEAELAAAAALLPSVRAKHLEAAARWRQLCVVAFDNEVSGDATAVQGD